MKTVTKTKHDSSNTGDISKTKLTYRQGSFALEKNRPLSQPISEDGFWKIVFENKPRLTSTILRENSDFCDADSQEIFSMLCDRYHGEKYKLMGFPTHKKLIQRMRWCKEDYRRKWKMDRTTFVEPVQMDLVVRKERGGYTEAYMSNEIIDLISERVLPHLSGRHLLILQAAISDPGGGFNRTAIYETLNYAEKSKFLPTRGSLVTDGEATTKKAISSRVSELRKRISEILAKDSGLLGELIA